MIDPALTPGSDPHLYLSTSCQHADHSYCQNQMGQAGPKRPATCKFCAAPCLCGCHTGRLDQPFRLLTTGSRDFDDVGLILSVLTGVVNVAQDRPVVVVHGVCSSGADWHADHLALWMRGLGRRVDVEHHPAVGHPTENFGGWPGAGPRRNAHMVGLGADLCAAFIGPCTSGRCHRPSLHPSHGASDCARRTEAAGIPTLRWYRGRVPAHVVDAWKSAHPGAAR